MKPSYYVRAIWDADAEVWVSETDIPGLVIEADTLAEFEQAMMELAPELLATNENRHSESVPVCFEAQARREFALPA